MDKKQEQLAGEFEPGNAPPKAAPYEVICPHCGEDFEVQI